MQIKRTKSDFNKFKSLCKKWVNAFGLTEWHIDYVQSDITSQARTEYNLAARHACFILPFQFEVDYCYMDDLNKLALHEVLHLAMSDLIYEANITKEIDDVTHTEHALINRLMRVII